MFDYLPLVSNKCVERSLFPQGLSKLTKAGADLVSLVTGEEKLASFAYDYDREVGLGMTRQEIGLWLVVGLLAGSLYSLQTMGDQKTVFDFMRPAAEPQGT